MARETEIEPLVTEVLAGRTDKFREIVLRFEKPLYNFVLNRVRDDAVALVITGASFVAAHDSLADFPSSRLPFRSWLYRQAFKLCLEWFRHGGRAVAKQPPGRPARERLFAWLERAPGADREMLVMRYIDGLRDPEIAQVTGLDVDAVRARIRAGLRALASAQLAPKEAQSNGL